MAKPKFYEKPELDPRLLDAFYCVEADSFSRFELWRVWNERVDWEEDSMGFAQPIGEFGGMPIYVEFLFAKINGKRVAFYHCCSMVSHSGMVEEWLEKYVPAMNATPRRNHCDAMNFHNCVLTIEEDAKKVSPGPVVTGRLTSHLRAGRKRS